MLSKFGSAAHKVYAEDLWPLTARHLATLPQARLVRLKRLVFRPICMTVLGGVKDNITKLEDVAEWWALFRDGATPLVDDEDKDFIAEAFVMLPHNCHLMVTLGPDWTTAVKEKTGRKGKGLFMPLRKAMRAAREGRNGRCDATLAEKTGDLNTWRNRQSF